MNIKDVLKSRWKWDDKRLAPVHDALLRTLDLHDAIRNEHKRIGTDNRLSRLGAQEAFRNHLSKELAPEIARSHRLVGLLRKKVDAWKEKLKPVAPDKTDTNAAILRSEMRQMLLRMKSGERHALLLSKDPDEILIAAVLEGPNLASGIDHEVREKIIDAAVNRAHPEQLRLIAETEYALEVLEVATHLATNAARDGAEFPDAKVLTDFVEEAVGSKKIGIDGELASTFAGLDDVAR